MRAEESKKVAWPNVGKIVYSDAATFIVPKDRSRRRYSNYDDDSRPSNRANPTAWKVQSETQQHLVLVALKPDRGSGIAETKVILKESTSELSKFFESVKDVWLARIDEAQDSLAGAEKKVKEKIKDLTEARVSLDKIKREYERCIKLGGVKTPRRAKK